MKNRSLDRKRISLTQSHELAYLRKIAREIPKEITYGVYSHPKIKRITKAFLLVTSKKKIKKMFEVAHEKTALIELLTREVEDLNEVNTAFKPVLVIVGVSGFIFGLIAMSVFRLLIS